MHIVVNREDLQRLYTDWVNGAEALRVTKNADHKRPADSLLNFDIRLQAVVPAGARMMVLVDYPYLLDFRRNKIVN